MKVLTEEDYPFAIKTSYSTLHSVAEIRPGRRWQISLLQDDTLGDLLGFTPEVIHDEFTISGHPVDVLSNDNIFLKTKNAQEMLFEGK